MKENEKQKEVVVENEETVSDEALQQFIFDDNQLDYYSNYDEIYLSIY